MKLSRPKPPYGPHPWGFNSNRPQFTRRAHSRPSPKRAFELDTLEPRLMLSADGVVTGMIASMTTGMTAVGTEIDQMFTKPVFDALVPGVVEPRTTGSDTRDVSPTLREALSISVDVSTANVSGVGGTLAQRFNAIGSVVPGFFPPEVDLEEAALRTLDLNNDQQVSVDEAFKVFFVGRLQDYLNDINFANQAGDDISDLTQVGLQVANFLKSDPLGTEYGIPNWLTDRVTMHIDNVTSTLRNGVLSWDADFSISLIQNDRFDLGYEADKLGIALDPLQPAQDPATKTYFKVPVYSTLDFGSLNFGFVDVGAGDKSVGDSDFFFSSDDIRVGVNVGTTAPNTPVPVLIDVNVGFLGAQTKAPSGVILDMDVVGKAVDPSNVDALGFTEAQQGVAAPTGTITASNSIDVAGIAASPINFSLKIGTDPTHFETELTMASIANANAAAVVTALTTSISNAGLGGLITAGQTGGKITFSVAASNPTPLGFSNEQLGGGQINAGSYSSLIGTGKSSTAIQFLLSVNNVWKIISFNTTIDVNGADNKLSSDPGGVAADDADNNAVTIDSLVSDLNAAVSAAFAGASASKTGAAGDERLRISGPGNIEISKTLTIDTVERITLAEMTASQIFDVAADSSAKFLVNLNLEAKSGLEQANSATPYVPTGTLKVDINPFTQVTSIPVDTIPGSNPVVTIVRPSFLLTDSANKALKWTSGLLADKPDLQTMLDFNVINVADILGTLSEIGTWFERLTGTDLLQGFDLPFGDVTLGDLLNLKDLLTDKLLFDDGDDGVNGAFADAEKLLKKVVKDGQTRLVAVFGTAQQLETSLNSILGINVDGSVFVDSDGRQNLTYTIAFGDSFDLAPNTAGSQPLVVPLDFEMELGSLANFETSGKLSIAGSGNVGFTLGVILGNAVPALDANTVLTDLNSKTGAKLNTNLALTTLGDVTPLIGRLSGDAKFDITVIGGSLAGTYTITIPKSATQTNKSLLDLRADIDGALISAVKFVALGQPGIPTDLSSLFKAEIDPVQSPTISAPIALQLKSSATGVTRFQVSVESDNPAFTELGLRTQSASTVQLVAPDLIAASLPAGIRFKVVVQRSGGADPDFTTAPLAVSGAVPLQALINDLNLKLPSGIVASQSGGRLILSAVDRNIEAFSVTDVSNADKLGLKLSTATTALQAAGVVTVPSALIAGVQLRGGAGPGDPFGRLADPATFTINGTSLTVPSASGVTGTTADNRSTDDLIKDINLQIETTGLKGLVAAINDGGRITFRSIALSLQTITLGGLSASESTALGLVDASTTDGPLSVRPISDAPVSYGVSEDVAFKVNINGTEYTATLTRDNTILNRSLFDLAASLNSAMNVAVGGALKNPLIATVQAGQIVVGLKTDKVSTNLVGDASNDAAFTGVKPTAVTAFSLSSTNQKFADELKLIKDTSTPNQANKVDFIIYFRDGTSAPITLDAFDGLDVDANQDQKLDGTLGALMTSIQNQTAGRVSVGFNSDFTALKLTDNTLVGSALFRVVGVNGSPAAAQLGILGSDTSNLNVGEVPASSTPVVDHIIEGGKIATADLRDRVYLKDASASAALTVTTVGTVSAEATFGFAGIKVQSSNNQQLFTATATLPLLDPPAGTLLTLRKMFNALGNEAGETEAARRAVLLALVGDPTLTLSSDFSFDVSVFPSVGSLMNIPGSPSITFKTGNLVVDLNDQLPDPGKLLPNLDFNVQLNNFGDLLKFETISFSNVIDAMQAIAKFLKQFETFDFLDADIPVLGVSVNELIDLADQFQKAINNFQQNPAGGIQTLAQRIMESLGLPNFADTAARDAFFSGIGINPASLPPALKQLIQFTIDGNILRFDLRLPVGFNKALKVDLDLQHALPQLPDAVDIQGAANLAASGFLDAKLSFGINLNTPTQLLIVGSPGTELEFAL